jgi:CheY-like chemotaxis protein
LFGYCDLSVTELENRSRPLDRQAIIEYIEAAKELADRAALFTKQLLAFSRGQILEPHSLDLNKIIQDFAPLTITRLIGENIHIRYNLADDLPAVYLDLGQIHQILLNLAINARDAMPEGGQITIETRVAQPKEAGHKPSGTKDPTRPQVIMQFRDTGCGIDSETQKQIFEPFFTTKGLGGTGLGLAVVYSSIKQAGGSITCTSQVNKGTTFTIRFPAADTPPERTIPQMLDTHVRQSASYTILLAEDDKGIRHTLSTALRAAGYDVSTADNGQQALELFERDADYFHLLITDLLMPEMSGADLSSKIRRIKPHLPVLFISGYPADILQEGGSLPRETQFIGKPFVHKEILRKIDDMLYHLQNEVVQ